MNADIVVAADSSGDFTTLQAAINAVESNSTRRTIIYIKRGLYDTEKLWVPADKKNISLIGESRDETIISYHIYDCTSSESGNKCPAEDAAKWTGENIVTSATLTIYGDGFRAENLTIENTAGPVGQALAIAVQSDKTMFINCNITGYQDTIYLWGAGKRSYFENCLVIGRTDYIYGAGIAFFQECEIRSWGGGWITAPSTPQIQEYGYVFNECQLTYATGSPRAGDDGTTIALGRPWHDYPKVTWMNSYFCAEINPLGWPTTWNMDYASTSPDLELYEYNNTGPGADMSGRANWVGIRALADSEVVNYTVQKVMGGTDGWAPTAEAPVVKTFYWTDSAATSGWLEKENWTNDSLPSAGEIAIVDSGFSIDANGGIFTADLNMKQGSEINVTNSSIVSYLSLYYAKLSSDSIVSLSGKIATKDSNIVAVSGMLTINAIITGVHNFIFTDTGKVILNANNESFAGDWLVRSGTLEANTAGSLGTGSVYVNSGANLIISDDNALYPTSRIEVVSGSNLTLNSNISLSEFFIDDVMQPLGVYNSTTNPFLISGGGSITVGRPSVFYFVGGTNGNWDTPSNFVPQLLPEAGEKVICDREMETTSTVFTADIELTSTGGIRLRGIHKCTGTITMMGGSKLSYATSGTGFTLDAPIIVAGNVIFQMSSANVSGSAMRLPGTISGSSKITAQNNRNIECVATVVLSGDNSGFDGIWDLTSPNVVSTSVTAFEAAGENSLGFGKVVISEGNKLVLNHSKCAGDTLSVEFTGIGTIELTQNVAVEKFILNNAIQDTGIYSTVTNPDIFTGIGELYVGKEIPEDTTSTSLSEYDVNKLITITDNNVQINGDNVVVQIYNMNGILVEGHRNKNIISIDNLKHGIYIIKYKTDQASGNMKFVH